MSARDGDDYVARRAERDRAYTTLRHEEALAQRYVASESDTDREELAGAA